MVLLVFEWTGQDTATSSYTFKLQNSLNFTALTLKDVHVTAHNDALSEQWDDAAVGVEAPATRDMTAPLYLSMNFTNDYDVAHFMPGTFSDGSGRVNTVSNSRVDIGHALAATGSTIGRMRPLDYPVITHETHWEAGKEITLGIQYRSVETPGIFDDISDMTDSVWDNSCRVAVTFEAEGGGNQTAQTLV